MTTTKCGGRVWYPASKVVMAKQIRKYSDGSIPNDPDDEL
jgi:hypothetical protein